MFFYAESGIPKLIANRNLTTTGTRFPQALNLTDAQEGDLLVAYALRGGSIYGVQNFILASPASNNWYNLPETKTGTVTLNYFGGMIQSIRNCNGSSMGTMVNSFFSEVKVTMKKLTAQDLSGQVTLSCYEESNISYLIIRNVNSYDLHRNNAGGVYVQDFDADIYSRTASTIWPTTNTNIVSSTKKLFIIGQLAAGTVTINSGTNISKSTSVLQEIDLPDVTGNITLSLNRGGPATSFLYNSNTVYAPWAAFMAFIVS